MFSSRKSVRAQILMIAVGISLLTMGSGRAKADFVFGEPVNLGAIVNSSSNDGLPCLSADGLSLFFASLRSGGLGGWDIWVARRATIDDDWGAPVNLGPNVKSSAGPMPWGDGIVDVEDLVVLIEHIVEAKTDADSVDEGE